jgi:hypothetical protein
MFSWLRAQLNIYRPAPSGPVRYMFPLVVGFSAFLVAVALGSSVSYSFIRIAPSKTTVTAGERFTIDIYAHAHVPVNAVDIALRFSDEAVEILGIDTGRSVITLWTEEPSVKGNIITLRGGTFARGFRSEHLIASVTARAKHTGKAEFFVTNLSLLAGDGRGTPVLTSTPNQSKALVAITSPAEGATTLAAEVAVAIVTDIDGDGEVTLRDVAAFLSAWQSRELVYDFNNDGKMTFRDFGIILSDLFFNRR